MDEIENAPKFSGTIEPRGPRGWPDAVAAVAISLTIAVVVKGWPQIIVNRTESPQPPKD